MKGNESRVVGLRRSILFQEQAGREDGKFDATIKEGELRKEVKKYTKMTGVNEAFHTGRWEQLPLLPQFTNRNEGHGILVRKDSGLDKCSIICKVEQRTTDRIVRIVNGVERNYPD